MTNKTRRTEIQIETHKVTVIRTRGKEFLAYCEHCSSKVTAFTANQTAELLQMTESGVFRMVEKQEFHLVASERGPALICCNSFGNEKRLALQAASTSSK